MVCGLREKNMKLLQKTIPASFQYIYVPYDYLKKNEYLFGKINGY